mgnify:CR=1 FL=1
MIYSIGITSLDKEIKDGLFCNRYKEDEVRSIYHQYLELKKQRYKGFKTAGVTLVVVFVLMPLLAIFSGRANIIFLIVQLFLLPIFALLCLGLAYYFMFGMFSQQLRKAMKVHYGHIIEEMDHQK